MDLDTLDKKIIYALYHDAKISLSSLSKILRTNKTTLQYRINKLKQNNIIEGILPVINAAAFESIIYDIYIKVKKGSQEIQVIEEFLAHDERIGWSSKLIGEWDYHFEVWTNNKDEFFNTLQEITTKFSKLLINYHITTYFLDKAHHQLFDFDIKIPLKTHPRQGRASLNEKDYAVLRALSTAKTDLNYKKIGDQCSISMETARNHVLALQKKGVITRFIPFIQPKKVGMNAYLLNINYIPHKEQDQIKNFLMKKKSVVLVLNEILHPAKLCLVFTKDINELEELISELREHCDESIVSVSNHYIVEEFKLSPFPLQIN